MNEEVVMVPLAAYESQAQHFHQTMRYMIIGWVITVALFVWLGIVMTSYEEQVVEETTETTAEVIQEANDSGSNLYAGGNVNGYPAGQDDDQEND